MKRTCMVVCVFVLVAMFVWTQTGEAAPQLEVVDGTSFDFGEIQPRSKVAHTFILKNQGERLLKIKSVKAG